MRFASVGNIHPQRIHILIDVVLLKVVAFVLLQFLRVVDYN